MKKLSKAGILKEKIIAKYKLYMKYIDWYYVLDKNKYEIHNRCSVIRLVLEFSYQENVLLIRIGYYAGYGFHINDIIQDFPIDSVADFDYVLKKFNII